MPSILSRLPIIVAKYGVFRAVTHILTKPFRSTHVFLKYTFNNYNYIFKFDQEYPHIPEPEGFSVKRYDRIEDIPLDLLARMKNDYGEKVINTDLFHMKQKGCTFWIAFLNDDIACKRLSRIAAAIPKWFIPLNPGDQVFLRGNTLERHRGKGVSPALIQQMISQLSTSRVDFYVDCSIHNEANIKSLPKAGFKIIAKMKPINER